MPAILASLTCRSSRLAQPTVLVLDASAALGLSIIRSLRKYGVHAVLATSGGQALQSCKAHDVRALIFNDDARGARHHLAVLERTHPELPTAFIGSETGAGSDAVSEVALTAHFSKPLDVNVLVEQLTAWVGPDISSLGAEELAWSASAAATLAATAPELTPGERTTRQLGAVEAGDDSLGSAPTQQIARVETSPVSDRISACARRRVTGSYSIVHRRQTTAQMAGL